MILEMEEASGGKAKIRNRTNEIEDSGSEPNDENGYWAPRKRMRRRSTTLVETERVYRYLPVSYFSFTSVRSSIVTFFFDQLLLFVFGKYKRIIGQYVPPMSKER